MYTSSTSMYTMCLMSLQRHFDLTLTKTNNPRFHQQLRIVLISAFAFVFCYFFPKKNQYFNERNECERMQRKYNDLNDQKYQRTTVSNEKRNFLTFFLEKFKKNNIFSRISTGQTRRSSRYIRTSVIYVTSQFALQSFKTTARSRSQNASNSSRYMVVVFVPQSFL